MMPVSGRQPLCGVSASFAPTYKSSAPSRFGVAAAEHRLGRIAVVPAEPQFKPVGEHADAEQRLRVGMLFGHSFAVVVVGECVAGFELHDAHPDRDARLREVGPIGDQRLTRDRGRRQLADHSPIASACRGRRPRPARHSQWTLRTSANQATSALPVRMRVTRNFRLGERNFLASIVHRRAADAAGSQIV